MQEMQSPSSDSDNHADGVLSWLLSDQRDAHAVIQEIEQALQVGADFPAALDLVKELRRCLLLVGESKRASDWLLTLEAVQAAGDRLSGDIRWVKLSQTTRAGNPLGGRFSKYPIPAFLLQQPSHLFRDSGALFKTLLITALLVRPEGHQFTAIADRLRRVIAKPSPQDLSVVAGLPLLTNSLWLDYVLEKLNALSKEERFGSNALIRDLKKLAGIGQSLSIGLKEGSPVRAEKTAPVSESGTHRGQVSHHHVQVIAEADTAAAEPPEAVDLHITDSAEATAESPSEVEIDIQARETRYWISRYQRLTPNDPSRFTSIERKWIARTLIQLLQSRERSDSLGAGVVSLMYVTGMTLDALLVSTIGPECDFDAQGVYRRTVRMPPGAYKPEAALATAFEVYQNQLVLKLPPVLAQWMQQRFSKRTSSLSACLGGDDQHVRQSVEKVMILLRDSGRFQRIRLDRITAALAMELTLAYRNPVVTYQLASGLLQVAPMLSYYIVHSVDDLAQRYSQTVEKMLVTA